MDITSSQHDSALQRIRILFMGTPEFAVSSLDALIRAGCQIVGVVTAPDKPSGRGMKLSESAVKKYALEKGLKLLQPVKLKDPQFHEAIRELRPDLQVVVAFRMLPEIVWSWPPMGTINLHASLLPQYRGAAPIQWAVINGETVTGLTTFQLEREIDMGRVLMQEALPIGAEETAGELHDRMKSVGADLLVKTVAGLATGELKGVPQQAWIPPVPLDLTMLRPAPKIDTSTCRIDWNQSVTQVYNLVRGLSPSPAAFTMVGGKTLKIFRATRESGHPLVDPGVLQADGKNGFKIACPDGWLIPLEVQMEGKKRMPVSEFIKGFRLE